MAESKKKQLNKILEDFGTIGDIEGSAIVTRDGLLIASQLSQDIDAEIFAAMSATMIGAAETAVSELKKGTIERVIVEAKEAKLIGIGAGPNSVLISMVQHKANLGLVLVEMNMAAIRIKKELK